MINKTETFPQYFSTEPQQVYESTGQQANKPTSQQVNEFSEVWWGRRVWVCLGQKGPIDGPKHRFNPLNPINTHFLTNIITPPSLTDFQKKLTQIQPIQQTNL